MEKAYAAPVPSQRTSTREGTAVLDFNNGKAKPSRLFASYINWIFCRVTASLAP